MSYVLSLRMMESINIIQIMLPLALIYPNRIIRNTYLALYRGKEYISYLIEIKHIHALKFREAYIRFSGLKTKQIYECALRTELICKWEELLYVTLHSYVSWQIYLIYFHFCIIIICILLNTIINYTPPSFTIPLVILFFLDSFVSSFLLFSSSLLLTTNTDDFDVRELMVDVESSDSSTTKSFNDPAESLSSSFCIQKYKILCKFWTNCVNFLFKYRKLLEWLYSSCS